MALWLDGKEVIANALFQGTFLPVSDNTVTIGSASLGFVGIHLATNVFIKGGGGVDIRNSADNAWVSLGALDLSCYNNFGFANTGSELRAPNADDAYIVGKARDNGNAVIEIWRMAGAADPYFSTGGSQQNKFYESGITELAGIVGFGAADSVTLDTDGDFTVTSSCMKVIPFGGAGSTNDSIVNIEGAAEGTIIILYPNATVNGGNDQITITDTGNVKLAGTLDFVMNHVDDIWMAIYNGTNWREISRSSNS